MLRSILRAFVLVPTLALLMGCASPGGGSAPVRLPVTQLERGVLVWLPDHLLFDFGSAELSPGQSAEYMDRLAWLLRERTTRSVSLEGHTDSLGAENINLTLSVNRAMAVRQALLQRGVAESRIAVSGFGYARPLAPNDSESGRRLNRRVEVVILGETLENLAGGNDGAFDAAFTRLRAELEARIQARERAVR